jgi:hypothetical protein
MPNGSSSAIERAVVALIEGDTGPGDIDALLRHRSAQLVRGVTLLLQNIIDHLSGYGVAGHSRDFVRACDEESRRIEMTAGASAEMLAGLLAFVGLNAELLKRRFEPPDAARQAESDAYCKALFAREPIRRAVHALYAPEGYSRRPRPQESPAVGDWRRLDAVTLRYFKAGTTSAILVARVGERPARAGTEDPREEVVIKCVLFPWNKMPAVAQATESYAETYGRRRPEKAGGKGLPDDPVVRPTSSTSRWVIMPKQDGETLRDQLLGLSYPAAPADSAIRIRTARQVSSAIVSALARLAEPATDQLARLAEPPTPAASDRPAGLGDRPEIPPARYPAVQHLDLSPSNIIMTARGDAKLIDLGRNHLYSRQVGIAEHDDSVYIAPEVKNRGSSPTADVYSLGMIMIEILAGEPTRDGRVPDSIYEMSPTLGRALDDLIEEEPNRRLLLLPAEATFSYESLRRFLDEAFSLTENEPVSSGSRFARWYARFAPASRELATQYRKWRAVRRSPGSRNVAYLLFFSLVACAAWWFVFARTAIPELADYVQSLPSLPAVPTAVALIAFAQGLMAAKYYQTVLARSTVKDIPGPLAWITELVVRSMTVVALPTTLLAVGWKPWLWAWSCTVGAAMVALANLTSMLMGRRLFALGRQARLSTVPPPEREMPRGFEQWWWTMLLYAAMIGVIAGGLQSGTLRDEGAYVFGLFVINIGIHYISKCAIAGPAIRGGLARACAVGERLTVLHQRGEREIGPWPPRFFANERDQPVAALTAAGT